MRVKITFLVKAESIDDNKSGADAGVEAFEVPFFVIKKNVEPKKFRPYLERLTKSLAGISSVLNFLNNSAEKG